MQCSGTHGLVLTMWCCFGGVDFGHGQCVSSLLLLDAVLSYAWLGADCFVLFLGRRFRPWTVGKFPAAANAMLSYAWLGADCFVCCFGGVDFVHGQAVSSLLLLNAMLGYEWLGADYVVLFLGRRFRPWTGGKFPAAAECNAQVHMAWC